MTFWRKNGHLVGIYDNDDDYHPMFGSKGIPIRCDSCPCDGGRFCRIKANSRKNKLLASGDYELVSQMDDNFNCAEFEYNEDNGQWECVRHSEGTLVQVIGRSSDGMMPDDFYLDLNDYAYGISNGSSSCVYLTSGFTLRNIHSGEYVTIGCKCNYDTNSHSCNRQYVRLDGYCITGEVNVYDDDESYGEHVVCSPDTCDASETVFSALQSWYGGRIYGEGFIVDKTTMNEGTSDIPTFTVFRKLYVFQTKSDIEAQSSSSSQEGDKTEEGEEFDNGHYMIMDCNCYVYGGVGGGVDLYGREWDSSRMMAVEREGICDSECRNLEYLRGWADAEEWTLHGEGFFIHLAYSTYQNDNSETEYMIGDWYDFGSRMACMECAESSDSFYFIQCNNCSSDYRYSYIYHKRKDDPESIVGGVESSMDISNYPEFWNYLVFQDACICNDEREILLTYPDEFGVVDISFGSNTKYKCTQTYRDFMPDTGETVHTESWYGMCSSRNDSDVFLDYRTMCIIMKSLGKNETDGGNVKHLVRWISPEGSRVGNGPTYTYSYDFIEFAGHAVPFTHDDDLNWDWVGTVIQWTGSCGMDMGMIQEGCYETAEKASQACNDHWIDGDDTCTAYGSYSAYPNFLSRVSPPDKTHNHYPCEFFTCEDPNGYGYTHGVRYAYDTLGRKFEMRDGEYSYNLYIVYREQYIQTNLGYMRYGEDGYISSFTVYGVHGSYGEENYSGSPPDDMVMNADFIDESMHDCSGHDVVSGFFEAIGNENDDAQSSGSSESTAGNG